MKIPVVISVLMLLGLHACRDPMLPPPPSGLFVLERVSGAALPIVTEDATNRYFMIADSLTVGRDGRGEQITVHRTERLDGSDTPYTIRRRAMIALRRTESGIEILRSCPIVASCLQSPPPDAVQRIGDGLLIIVGEDSYEYRDASAP